MYHFDRIWSTEIDCIIFFFRIVPSVVSPTPPHVAYTLPPGINYSLIHGIKLGDLSRDSQADYQSDPGSRDQRTDSVIKRNIQGDEINT